MTPLYGCQVLGWFHFFGRKYFLDIKIKGQSDPRKDAIFYGYSDVSVSFFSISVQWRIGVRIRPWALWSHRSRSQFNSWSVWSVFLMRTRLGITIVGGGRGRACVCDGSTLYTKIMYPPLAIAPSRCGIILHRLMSLDTSLMVKGSYDSPWRQTVGRPDSLVMVPDSFKEASFGL